MVNRTMNKINGWNEELKAKVLTEETLKYRQVQSLKNSLSSLFKSISEIVENKKSLVTLSNDSLSEHSETVFELREGFNKEADNLSSRLLVQIGTLSMYLDEHSKRTGKAKLKDKELFKSIQKDLEDSLNFVSKNTTVSKSRALILKHLNNVFNVAKYALVFDLEMTCDQDKDSMKSETIEVGLVVVDMESLEVVDTFESFVKPVLNPVLTRFASKLTGITQEDVDSADGYEDVSSRLGDFLEPYRDAVALQWGTGDMRQIVSDCDLHNVPNPFGEIKHYDLKKSYGKMYYQKNSIGLRRVMEMLGIERVGDEHRALSDAMMTFEVMKFIKEKWSDEYKKMVLSKMKDQVTAPTGKETFY